MVFSSLTPALVGGGFCHKIKLLFSVQRKDIFALRIITTRKQ